MRPWGSYMALTRVQEKGSFENGCGRVLPRKRHLSHLIVNLRADLLKSVVRIDECVRCSPRGQDARHGNCADFDAIEHDRDIFAGLEVDARCVSAWTWKRV